MTFEIATTVIETTPDQRQQACMMAMGLPMMIAEFKTRAADKGYGNMVAMVIEKLAAVGITEEVLFDMIREMATAEDLRITVDGELLFRVVPE